MCLVKLVVFYFLCAQVCSFELERLIRRIEDEIGLTTVRIVGNDKEFYENFTGLGSDIPVTVLTSADDLVQITKDEFNHNSIVVIPNFDRNHQSREALLEQFVSSLRVRKFIIVVAKRFDDLYKPFSYFYKIKFSRIFGVAAGIGYAYLPYAIPPIQVIPEDGSLPNAFSNLNGFSIRSDIVQYFPQAFWYPDNYRYPRLGGTYGHLLDKLIRKCNATLKEVKISDVPTVSIWQVMNALNSNKIDISLKVFSPMPRLDYSYPLKFLKWSVLVPLNGYIDPNQLFLRPFSPATWLFIGIAFLYIVLMDYVKDMWILDRLNLWNSFSRIFLIIIGRSPPTPITSAYRFYVLVIVFSFFLTNIYITFCTQFLTVSIKVKQFNTIQDLIDNEIRIIVPDEDRKFIELLNHSAAFKRVVTFIDTHEYNDLTYYMDNTSFPFAVGDDYATFLIRIQAFFREPLFHKTLDDLSSFGQSYLMAEYSPFKDMIDKIILNAIGSGLIEKWDSYVVWEAIRAGYKPNYALTNRSRQTRFNRALELGDLTFAWNCLTIGWILSFKVFAVEQVISIMRRHNSL